MTMQPVNSESPEENPPLTGPGAIEHALSKLNVDAMEEEHRGYIRDRKVSKKPRAIHVLNTIEGMRRNDLKPTDLMLGSVPVIPPVFRPFSVVGDVFIPGDANELYRDLFDIRSGYSRTSEMFGESEPTHKARLNVYDSVKALFGYGDPVKEKTKQRGVSGFLRQITGANPKVGFFQRKLLAKTVDSVGRGTIVVDPDLSLDEIAIPEKVAWNVYSPYIQRRLVRAGMPPADAIRNVKNQSEQARRALLKETEERPVIYSRAPAWHRFNVVAGRPKLIDGDAIAINPLVGTGLNADHDGDAINVHVPSQPEAVKEAIDRLMPSKMLNSIRDPDRVVPVPKHEHILGLYTANKRKAAQVHRFPNEAAAMAAVKSGVVPLSDEVVWGR